MSKVVVRFYSNTSSPYVADAIDLAKSCEHFKEGNYYFVHFNEFDNNLAKLLDIVSPWKTTQIHLDDKEVNIRLFERTFFCSDKKLCNGICTHSKIGFSRLDNLLKQITKSKGLGFVDRNVFQDLTPFLEKTEEKYFILDKEKLQDFIKRECSFELENCQHINEEKIFNLIRKFPDKIDLGEKYDDYPNGKEESEAIEKEKERIREANIEFAEILADAFEKRLRIVLNEFFPNKK